MGGIVSRPSAPPPPPPVPEPVKKIVQADTGPSSAAQDQAGRRRAMRGGRQLLAGSSLGVGPASGAVQTQTTLGPARAR